MQQAFKKLMQFTLIVPVFSLLMACNDSNEQDNAQSPDGGKDSSKPAVIRCAP